ncbi:MAG TPA: hypothetical protein VL522_05150, partial [Bordetella sp.]|nr:hypothetical protein [Bordetella sp.]
VLAGGHRSGAFRPASSRAGPFALGTYSRTVTHPDPVVIVVVVVVVTMVVTPLHSGMPPVETGRKDMQAGEMDGDMDPTLGRLLQCSQQVRLKLSRRPKPHGCAEPAIGIGKCILQDAT